MSLSSRHIGASPCRGKGPFHQNQKKRACTKSVHVHRNPCTLHSPCTALHTTLCTRILARFLVNSTFCLAITNPVGFWRVISRHVVLPCPSRPRDIVDVDQSFNTITSATVTVAHFRRHCAFPLVRRKQWLVLLMTTTSIWRIARDLVSILQCTLPILSMASKPSVPPAISASSPTMRRCRHLFIDALDVASVCIHMLHVVIRMIPL